MYIPRLRRISDVLKEVKAADPQTVISRWFIVHLIRSRETTSLKFGDAGLINTDELYGYLSGSVPQDFNYTPLIKRDLMMSGEIYCIFLHRDADTKIRKLNIRLIVKEHGFWYFVLASRKWYIAFNDFMEKINPRHINEKFEMPRLR